MITSTPGLMDATTCQNCEAPLPAASPGGLCPACLMAEAMGPLETMPGETMEESHSEPFGPDPLEGSSLGIGGRYKILQRIGEGGFGTVFMAEQSVPMRRRVAIKVLKAGMDTRQVLARFEAESQALAMMDHPNIARVFDSGETPEGRPYFVMELVRGTPITTYCDREELDTRTRLGLFVQVCRAVQHAHQKGIIHRDLKPGNILITVPDGAEPVPKVIDFGVAKAMETPLTDKTLFTRFEQMIGTPAYMSPEQAGSEAPSDIDTRADIYALGVLLYELLTGTTPIESETLQQAAFDEVRRILREEEPPRPSTRLSSLEQDRRSTVAKEHGTEFASLGKQLRGDLDWIVMCAIEKDRRRRYETANALARDVERHLDDEPVAAGAPSAAYRTGKFIRRNRRAVATMAVVSLAIVCGLILALVGFARARMEAQHAREAEKETEAARREAEIQRDEALWNQYVARQFPIVDAWERQEFGHLEEMLEQLKPGDGQPDFRGWEWTYFKDQCDQVFKAIGGKCPAWHPQKQALALVMVGDQATSAIELRSPEDGSLLRTIAEVPTTIAEDIRLLRWSLDGTHLAYLTYHAVVAVLAIESGDTVFQAKIPVPKRISEQGNVTGIDLSHDGRTLATGNFHGLIQLWDVTSGERVRVLHDPERQSNLTSIRFNPTSDQLAAAMRFGERKTWNLETGEACSYTHQSLKNGMVSWNRSGTRFASTEDNNVVLRELNRSDPIASLHLRGVNEVTWIGDDRLVSSGGDHLVRVWDAHTLVELAKYQLDRSPVSNLCAGKDGDWLAVQTSEGIKIVDLKKSSRSATVLAAGTQRTSERHDVAWGQKGRLLASAHLQFLDVDSFQTPLRIWNLATGTIVREQSIVILRGMGWDADQSGLLATSIRGDLYRLPVGPGQLETLGKLAEYTGNSKSSFSPDGRWMAFGNGKSISLIDVNTKEVMNSRDFPGEVWSVRWSNDSRLVSTVTWAQIRTWDPFSDRFLAERMIATKTESICWNPEDRLLALGRVDGAIQIFQADSLEEIALFRGHSGPVTGLHWSPHGRIASAAGDGTVRIWDAATGHELLAFHHPDQLPYFSVAWSPDGRRLAAGDSEGRVFIWGSNKIEPLPPGSQGLSTGVIAEQAGSK